MAPLKRFRGSSSGRGARRGTQREVQVNSRLILPQTASGLATMQSEQALIRRTSLGSQRTQHVQSWVTQQFANLVSNRAHRLPRQRPGSTKSNKLANYGQCFGMAAAALVGFQGGADAPSVVQPPRRPFKTNRRFNDHSRPGRPARTRSKLERARQTITRQRCRHGGPPHSRIRKQDSS